MWILSEYKGENYGIINLNYVSRIYMEYETENQKGNRLLADYKGETICLGEYETEKELQDVCKKLGAEMARTGIGIVINRSEEQTTHAIKSDISIDLGPIFDSLTSENKMFVAKCLLTSMTDEELKDLIKLCQFQISDK